MTEKTTSEEAYSKLIRILEESRSDISDLSGTIENLQTKPDPRAVEASIATLVKKVIDLDSRIVQAFGLAETLYTYATSDGLTGFRTKTYFDTVVKPRLNQYPDLAYLMIDIDHFKRYNDLYGHPQGDEAIRSITSVIRKVAPTDLLFRFGGEEFSVIVVGYDADKEKAYRIADNIRTSVESNIIPIMTPTSVADDLTARIVVAHRMRMSEDFRLLVKEFGSAKHADLAEHEQRLNGIIELAHSETVKYPDACQEQKLREDVRKYLYNLQRATVSIGGAVRVLEEPIDELVKRADDALYIAKRMRNCVFIAE